jgi:hypothetical protein
MAMRKDIRAGQGAADASRGVLHGVRMRNRPVVSTAGVNGAQKKESPAKSRAEDTLKPRFGGVPRRQPFTWSED